MEFKSNKSQSQNLIFYQGTKLRNQNRKSIQNEQVVKSLE